MNTYANGKPLPTEFIRLDLRNEDLRKKAFISWTGKNRSHRRADYYRSHSDRPRLAMVVLERAGIARPDRYLCDHINGDALDNRLANLRFVTRGHNRFNSRLTHNKKNGLPKGVQFVPTMKSRPYRSEMRFCGRRIHLGYFATPEEALEAYKTKAMELYGSLPYSVKG